MAWSGGGNRDQLGKADYIVKTVEQQDLDTRELDEVINMSITAL